MLPPSQVGVTFLLVLVGVVQVWLSFVQLKRNCESLIDAKHAADATKDATEAGKAHAITAEKLLKPAISRRLG